MCTSPMSLLTKHCRFGFKNKQPVTNDDNSNSPADKDFTKSTVPISTICATLSEYLHLPDWFPDVVNAPFFEEDKNGDQEEDEDSWKKKIMTKKVMQKKTLKKKTKTLKTNTLKTKTLKTKTLKTKTLKLKTLKEKKSKKRKTNKTNKTKKKKKKNNKKTKTKNKNRRKKNQTITDKSWWIQGLI